MKLAWVLVIPGASSAAKISSRLFLAMHNFQACCLLAYSGTSLLVFMVIFARYLEPTALGTRLTGITFDFAAATRVTGA
jgi:hypothetical protein